MDYKSLSYDELQSVAETIQKEMESRRVSNPTDILPFLAKYRTKKQEHFLVLLLDGNHQVMRCVCVTKGTLNRTIIHPREVFYPAIKYHTCAVILAHNHPSGTLEPSEDDKAVVHRMREAGEILGIKVLDHIIFGVTGVYSFLDHGI